MSNRSWFFASGGQQQGPYPEAQFRELIGSGTVTADTLVWSEGMAGWQKAGEIPGLLSGAGAPPATPQPGGLPINASGLGGGPLSIEFGIWEFIWRSLVLLIGSVFVIPVPWVVAMYTRWIVSCVRVPQRPNRPGGRPDVVLRPGDPLCRDRVDPIPGAQRRGKRRGVCALLALDQMVRCQSEFGWTTAWASLLRLILGLPGLEPAGGPFRAHHYRLGVGLRGANTLDVPSYRRHAARRCFQGHRARVSRAFDRDRTALRPGHPHAMDLPLVHPLAGVTGRLGPESYACRRLTALTCVRAASLPGRRKPPACRPA